MRKKFGGWNKIYIKKFLRPLLNNIRGEKPLPNGSDMGLTHKQRVDHPEASKPLNKEEVE